MLCGTDNILQNIQSLRNIVMDLNNVMEWPLEKLGIKNEGLVVLTKMSGCLYTNPEWRFLSDNMQQSIEFRTMICVHGVTTAGY